MARRYLELLALGAGWVLENIVAVLFGLDSIPVASPLMTFIHTQPFLAYGSGVTLGVVLIVATLFAIVTYFKRRRVVQVRRMAKLYIDALVASAYLLVGAFISIFLGLTAPPARVPLVALIHAYSGQALGLGLLLVCLTVWALHIHPRVEPAPSPEPGSAWRIPRAWVSLGISTTSAMLFTALLVTVVARAPWCPVALCPAPVHVVVTDPHGAHDANVDAYFTSLQSSALVLSENPAVYSLANLPQLTDARSIAAVRIDDRGFPPYRVVIGAHSVQQGGYGVVIEQVSLIVRHTSPLPNPLNVWEAGSLLDYHSNPYQATYTGEPVGATVSATYVPNSLLQVQLNPGESDELDIQVVSRVACALMFQIQIVYRVANTSDLHTLVLPQTFEADFSEVANWRPYQFQGMQLAPQG